MENFDFNEAWELVKQGKVPPFVKTIFLANIFQPPQAAFASDRQ